MDDFHCRVMEINQRFRRRERTKAPEILFDGTRRQAPAGILAEGGDGQAPARTPAAGPMRALETS
ncbi:hypothetical protein [Nonomuraea typhae]|uniref:Uncharacterized protein n=1 Tax=Nonomuraea typhae TaxID=2603600 RepID=A0ABW7Z8Y7_9ACTN